jgi:hypothetical protein
MKIPRKIKIKLNNSNVTITKFNKGNSIVILKTQDYNDKITNFINDN